MSNDLYVTDDRTFAVTQSGESEWRVVEADGNNASGYI